MKKKILLFAMAALILGMTGSLYVGWRYLQPAPQSPVVAKLLANKMPDVVNERAQSLSTYQGRTLVLNFWATWCAPCVEEMPELAQLQKDFAEHNVQVLGISIDTPDNVIAFAKKYAISYPLLLAGMTGSDLARQFGNENDGLPFTVLVTAQGEIKKNYQGRLNIQELRTDLLQTLKSIK